MLIAGYQLVLCCGFKPNHATVRSVHDVYRRTLAAEEGVRAVQVLADVRDDDSLVTTRVAYHDGRVKSGNGRGRMLEQACRQSCRTLRTPVPGDSDHLSAAEGCVLIHATF